MAITGIDTIEGKQIIAAGAVSAKSAEMAYNDENGYPITGYLTAVPEGYATTGDLATVSAKVAPSGIAVFQMYAPSSTYSAVTAAINAGKMVYAKDSDTYLPLTKWNSYYQILYFGSGPGGMGDGHATFTGNATMSIATLCNQHTGGDYSYGWSNSTTAIPNNSLVNNKLDKSAFSTVSSTFYTTANPSGFISEVPATYLQNTDLEISDNKVTGISGVPLAAGGGDVPEGVMVESGLEYDANNKISGYSGSAFAAGTELEFEYDAADNISAINSSAISTTPAQALYAQNPLYFSATGTSSYMGINSADLARMLGVDETVLYSGNLNTNNGTSFTLSEPLDNFETVKIWANDNNSWAQVVFETDPNWAGSDNVWRRTIPLTLNTIDADSNKIFFRGVSIKSPTTTNITSCSAWGWEKMDGGSYNTHDCRITKVIGIGRKEV